MSKSIDTIRTGLLPNLTENGTQNKLPNASIRKLNCGGPPVPSASSATVDLAACTELTESKSLTRSALFPNSAWRIRVAVAGPAQVMFPTKLVNDAAAIAAHLSDLDHLNGSLIPWVITWSGRELQPVVLASGSDDDALICVLR